MEHKLRALDAFLLDAADRRRARGFKADGAALVPAAPAAAGAGGGGGGLFGDGNNRLNAAAGAAMAGGFGGVGGVRGPMSQAGAPAAKRQRLWSAALYEEQRNNAIRYAASGETPTRSFGGTCVSQGSFIPVTGTVRSPSESEPSRSGVQQPSCTTAAECPKWPCSPCMHAQLRGQHLKLCTACRANSCRCPVATRMLCTDGGGCWSTLARCLLGAG